MTDVLDIINEHAEVVMEDTTRAPKPEWLAKRKEGIGGADAAAAAAMSPYDSRYGLWDEKVGDYPDEDNQYMVWGRRLEEPIGYGFAEDTGIGVMRFPKMLRSRQYPWAQVNIDFLTPDEPGVLEVKNVGINSADHWAGEGTVPRHILCQGLHELAVTGLDIVHFSALIGGNDPRYVKVERDQVAIDNLMEIERKFWELVQTNTPPAIDESEATAKALLRRHNDHAHKGTTIEIADATEVRQLLERRAELKLYAKTMKEELDGIENTLKALLGDAETAMCGKEKLFSWTYIHKDSYTAKESNFRQMFVPN